MFSVSHQDSADYCGRTEQLFLPEVPTGAAKAEMTEGEIEMGIGNLQNVKCEIEKFAMGKKASRGDGRNSKRAWEVLTTPVIAGAFGPQSGWRRGG